VTPEEAHVALAGAGLTVEQPVGVSFSPLSGRWTLGNDTAVNYMMVATRAAAKGETQG
jgi:2-polyprenyl-6-hydroxyphenyl methylase/3-demethylubiquinone-9 3-methyltransferase